MFHEKNLFTQVFKRIFKIQFTRTPNLKIIQCWLCPLKNKPCNEADLPRQRPRSKAGQSASLIFVLFNWTESRQYEGNEDE